MEQCFPIPAERHSVTPHISSNAELWLIFGYMVCCDYNKHWLFRQLADSVPRNHWQNVLSSAGPGVPKETKHLTLFQWLAWIPHGRIINMYPISLSEEAAGWQRVIIIMSTDMHEKISVPALSLGEPNWRPYFPDEVCTGCTSSSSNLHLMIPCDFELWWEGKGEGEGLVVGRTKTVWATHFLRVVPLIFNSVPFLGGCMRACLQRVGTTEGIRKWITLLARGVSLSCWLLLRI